MKKETLAKAIQINTELERMEDLSSILSGWCSQNEDKDPQDSILIDIEDKITLLLPRHIVMAMLSTAITICGDTKEYLEDQLEDL
jgi:hypothetical protein